LPFLFSKDEASLFLAEDIICRSWYLWLPLLVFVCEIHGFLPLVWLSWLRFALWS